MSLILEALKKSEAERQLGRVPGLLDAQPRARRRRRSWPIAALALLLLACVAGGAYWFGQRGQSAPFAPDPAPAGDEPRTASEPTSPADAATDRAPQRPSVVTASEPPSRLPSDPGFASVERESRPQTATALPAPPRPVEVAQPAAAAPVVAPSPRAPTPAAASPSPPLETAPAAAAQPPAVAAVPPAPAEPVLPELSSLGHEARGRLPPLKVSMHVYAEDPAARVVIIDGRRLREGDAIDGQLRLREIRRDGSVLELDGRHYRLPRP